MQNTREWVKRGENAGKCDELIIRQQNMKTSTEKTTFCAHRTRYLILLLVTLCLSSILSNTLTLNFAVICMSDPMPDINLYNSSGNIHWNQNGTFFEIVDVKVGSRLDEYEEAVSTRKYVYSPSEKSNLFSSVAIGAIISVYPSMVLIERFGTRWVLTGFGMFSAVVTALIPLAASVHIWFLLAVRVLQGTCLGLTFSVIGICTQQWSMHKQNAFYLAFLSCFFQIGPIFTMPVAGSLCSSPLGWPSVFYLHSLISLLLFALLFIFYSDIPHVHRNVSIKELDRIQRGKGNTSNREPAPMKAILTSHSVYVIWMSALTNFMGIQITMQFTPIFLNKVLGFSVQETGIYSSIPQIVTFVVKIAAGILSDKANCVSPLNSVRIFNTISLAGMGIFFIILAFVPPSAPITGLIILIITTSIIGFNCGAFFKASNLIARQHNHFIMGGNSFLNCLSTLLAPLIVNIFVKDDTASEWSYVWIIHGVLLILSNLYFCIFITVQPAKWTESAETTMHSQAKTSDTVTAVADRDPIKGFY